MTLDPWNAKLVCPLDHAPLRQVGETTWHCTRCDFESAVAEITGRMVPDFRAVGTTQTVALSFRLPGRPLDRDATLDTGFRAIDADFPYLPKKEIRARFGTKLDKGIQYYCQQLLREAGPDAPILDLGCGSGGNRGYLQSLGFTNILTTDWIAAGADMLSDAHRLPLADGAFRLVISTAVFEHLYNPFVAMSEISRVLDGEGMFLGSASFWEAWHGSSYFHLTPDGWNALLDHAELTLVDLWPGWGIVPSALTHVITPGHLRSLGYSLQAVLEATYRLVMGKNGVRRMQLRASGAYAVCARKARAGG